MSYSENETVNKLTTLLVNAEAIVSAYFNMFFNPNPIDVTLKQYDSDGVIQTYTVPNMAKYKLLFTRGYINPEGNVESKAGGIYLDVVTMTPYVKTSEDSTITGGSLGWVQILTPRELLAHNNDPESHLGWLASVHGSKTEYFNVAPAFEDEHAVQRVYIGLLESLKTATKRDIVSAINDLQDQVDVIVQSSDIFDIVGTYAGLLAYDTLTVPPNDIIKVLQDENNNNATTYYRCIKLIIVDTHADLLAYNTNNVPPNTIFKVVVDETNNNETTYYRCSKSGSVFISWDKLPDAPHNPQDYVFVKWDYVGEEGPYYTKTESDNRFMHLCKETPIEYATETIRGVKIFNNDNSTNISGCTTFHRDRVESSYIKFANLANPSLGYLGVDNNDHPVYLESGGSNWHRIVKMPTNTSNAVGSASLPVYINSDGIATVCTNLDTLPSQSGHGGQFLTTNGTSAFWADAASVGLTYSAGTGLILNNNVFQIAQTETKVVNLDNVDSLTLSGTNLSGFSVNDYAVVNKTLTPMGSTPWYGECSFVLLSLTPSSNDVQMIMCSDNYRFGFGVRANGALKWWVGSGVSSWDIVNGGLTSEGVIDINTKYYVRFGWDGTKYYLDLSTDKASYTTQLSVNGSTNSAPINFRIGISRSGTDPLTNGIVDLSDCKIYSGDVLWWQAIFLKGDVAKATTSLYGLVKPDGTSIAVNNGVISAIATVDQTYDGTSANAQSGVAIKNAKFIQNTATSTGGFTIGGTATSSSNAINIGKDSAVTTAPGGIAIGYGAEVKTSNAIQLGYGVNSAFMGLQVYSYPLLNGSTGLIPDARISTNIARTNDTSQVVWRKYS